MSFTGDAFLNWLNDIIIKDNNDKAKFLKREFVPNKEEMKLPRINF